jgi:hypothetical protein
MSLVMVFNSVCRYHEESSNWQLFEPKIFILKIIAISDPHVKPVKVRYSKSHLQ